MAVGVLVIAVVVVAVVVVVAATAAIIAAVKNTLHDEDEQYTLLQYGRGLSD